jgi:streptogramin lyase
MRFAMKKRPLMRAIVTIATILIALPAAAQTAPVITEFSLTPDVFINPAGITAGPDGNVWFGNSEVITNNNIPAIGRITSAGVIAEFTQGLNPENSISIGLINSIATGSDGNIWFTNSNFLTEAGTQGIGRITPSGVVTEFPLGPGFNPVSITAGPDGNLWFISDANSTAVGQITPAGVVTVFSQGLNPGSSLLNITAGPDGNLWFTDQGCASSPQFTCNPEAPPAIGRITPAGDIFEFSQGLNKNSFPGGITAGPDGNVWFTDAGGGIGGTNAIGRITPDGIITEFPLPVDSEPVGIVAGPDGNLWFTDLGTTRAIGRISPAGAITEFSEGLNPGAGPSAITLGPDGDLWFADAGATPAIGRITIAPSIPSELVAAVAPGSRSVEVGTTATVFADMINIAPTALNNCQIALPSNAPAGLSITYQTTNSMTNIPDGTPNAPVTIPGGDGLATFILSFQATTPVSAPGLGLQFECDGSTPATTIPGVNTVDLDFSATPVPDIIVVVASLTGSTVELPVNGPGAFAVSSLDLGIAAPITVSVDTGGATLPLALALCQTNPATGQCLGTPALSTTLTYPAQGSASFSVFLQSSGAIALNPAVSRVFVRFKDANGVLHGSASLAVQTTN